MRFMGSHVMTRYAIEAALFRLPLPLLPKFGHNFWILKEYDTNKEVAQLHGLATSRITGNILPMGFTKNHCLKAYHFNYDQQFGSIQKFFLPQHLSQCIVVGENVLELWKAAVAAVPLINRLDLNYPSCGFKVPFKTTVNSNSIYRTFAEIMGIEPYRFERFIQIGIERSITDQI